jgi:phosphate uptake regulator
LPKKWIEEMHLKTGDQITVARELDNSLLIIQISTGRPSESLNEVMAVIMPNEGSNTLKRKVVSIYLAGYNIIHLKLRSGRINPALRDAVREVIRRNLVGTEMVAEASDNITLQVLLSLPELSVNTAIRRMYLLASSMHKDAMSALAELNHDQANIKLVLENIRRTAEYASDVAETAMNETMDEVIEKYGANPSR